MISRELFFKKAEDKYALLERFQHIPVLNDGFVKLVDVMGEDSAIVRAARVSYGDGTKSVSEDEGLIRYLMRQRHTSPFEHCEISVHIRLPMDANRQHIRHRTANPNEASTRYSKAINSMQVTEVSGWRSQAKDNKQGSGDYLSEDIGGVLSEAEAKLHLYCREVYEARLEAGVAREQARKDLPLSTYTELYWKIDLHNLLHYLSLRMDKHAQLEIRQYANAIAEIVKVWCPFTWGAFEDYRLNAMSLTALDICVLEALLSGNVFALRANLQKVGWLRKDGNLKEKNRELEEFLVKYQRLTCNLPGEVRQSINSRIHAL